MNCVCPAPCGFRRMQGPPGPVGAQGPPGEPGENAPNFDLPIVQRIAVEGMYEGEWRPLILELDRPAPENCFLQFYRYSKKKRNRGIARNRSIPIKWAFRGVFVDGSSNPFPVIEIAPGQTTVALTWEEWSGIFRPVITRAKNLWREWDEIPINRPRHNPIVRNRASKVVYKFGTCEYIRGVSHRPGLMSADTLTVLKYYESNHGGVQQGYRAYID